MKLHEISVLSTMGPQPEKIANEFDCSGRGLTSLVGCPTSVGGYFNCDNNKLTSLEGCPSSVGDYFYCDNTKLVSLHDIHKHLKRLTGKIWSETNCIESHVLGLFLIEGITGVYAGNNWSKIVNRYIKQGKQGILACQRDLIDAGLEKFAQL